VRKQLQYSIVCLAQPAEFQLSLFPDFVCKADELALNFEDGLYELVGHENEVTDNQRLALDGLDHLLSEMSKAGNSEVWTDEAVRTHPMWNEVRLKAKVVADAFHWDTQELPPNGATYVRGGD